MIGRRKRDMSDVTAQPPYWQRVSAFANLGRLAVSIAKFAWTLFNENGPGPHL